MRLLHTADWHVGKPLHGIERLDETRAVLEELAEVAARERVDAILMAGDIIDRRPVDPTALGVALAGLSALAEVAPVVAVTGNHDDTELWGHLSPLLAARRITLASRVQRPDRAVIDLETAAGRLHIATLPWLEAARLGLAPGSERGVARTTYAADLAAIVAALADELRTRRRADGAPAVLLGHAMIDGSQTGAGERALTMALTYCLPTQSIPTDLDYIALGHIHRPQPLPGVNAPGRYCGSPLALDFSEDNHAKSVTVVDLGSPPREVPLTAGRPLVRLRGTLETLPALAAAHTDAWLRCEVELNEPLPELMQQVRAFAPNVLRVDPLYPPPVAAPVADPEADLPEGPGDLGEDYAAWYAADGRQLDPAVAAAFASALAAAQSDEGSSD